ncbi:putative ABC transporter [Xylaria sp. FL1042]|nr:putative ABC transporter [Xylaria sp. FL1042]
MVLGLAFVLHTISTICAAVLLLSLGIRPWKLRSSPLRGARSWRGSFKSAPGILLLAILTSYWNDFLRLDIQYKPDLWVSLLVSGLTILGLSLRLFHDEQYSHKSSHHVVLYLCVSILCDAIYLTLPVRAATCTNTSYPVLLRCCIHLVFLILECSAKISANSSVGKRQSPEELHGVLGRVLFTWINSILLQGYRNTLVDQDLPPLSQDMKPEVTRKAILHAWTQRAKPETDRTLPLVLMTCFKTQFFAAIIPRLLLIAFRYSQPILIKQSIRYVASYLPGSGVGNGYWLILAAVTIYLGRALSTSIYQRSINKLKLMTRSALIGLIHDKTMKSPSIAYDNGQAITLMNTDAESLDGLAEMAHETWAQVVEVLIGIILLANDVGWIWPLPLCLIYLCSHMSRYVAKHLQPRQEAWNHATQNRMAATSSVISSMKAVKMLGFQDKLTRRIQELRKEELSVASKQRWIVVYNIASANALGIFSPAITLIFFALLSAARGRDLDAETAFSTITLLGLITHPANMVMTIVPRAVGAFTGLKRIQAFLLQPSLHDSRGTLLSSARNKMPRDPVSGRLTKARPAIQIRQLNIGYKQPILEDVNIEIATGSFNIISGSTGSGKSTLMRAILGEVVPARGSISLSTRRIAYCSQRPWLPNGTIRETISGVTKDFDEVWYHEVTNLCCLRYDFDSLPYGDQTQIGSRGLNLSGGQRQRVALARALFERCDILLLDDTFSGLDGETEQSVFENLFGTTGLTRRLKTTVVLVSNSSQYFQLADNIVVLGERRVIDQGSWQDIKAKASSIAKFSSSSIVKENAVLSANFDKLSAQVRAKDEIEVDLRRHTGDPALYGYYFSFIGFTNLGILITTTAIYDFFITVPPYWLRLWIEVGGRDSAFYIWGLLFLSFMSWSSTSTMAWCLLIRLAPQSGSRLHRRLLRIVTSAPLSYFSQTENGSILNRFSQDIQIIDKQLPSALSTVIVQILKLLMQIIILCMAEKWLAGYLPVCVIVVYIVQKVYLRTSRQLRFLELQSQAGVFSSFLESIEGLETIRSLGWSEFVVQDNIFRVDRFQRAGYLLLCLQQWLNIVLDLLAAAVTISVVAIAVALRGRVSGAQVGIALNLMLVVNTTLLKFVLGWTELETSISSIARLKSLEISIPSEGREAKSLEPLEKWPFKGHVEFKDITASYLSSSTALRNVSLSIPAGQKLIVCGRTGSGKSTLLLTLLRLLDLKSGKIEVDGIDIKGVDIDVLRRRCFISASQDPLLLSNETLRFNVDPDISVSDETVIDILIKAGLWRHFVTRKMHPGEKTVPATHIPALDEHHILDRKLSLFQELSVGQCQLFALCRTLVKAASLRRSGLKPVILLDEVTSSLDSVTESTMYRIIDNEFTQKGHTVIIVAHRLGALQENTVIGRDAVVLMEDGKLLEVIQDLRPETFQRIGKME